MKFKFLPDIAIADCAFEAYGKEYSELFENACLALQEAMVDTSTVDPIIKHEIELENNNLDNLLFLLLEELVYLKDAEGLMFSRVKCELKSHKGKKWEMRVKLKGECINQNKHKLRDDVKAVTKHLFKIDRLSDKTYKCLVVLDI